MQHFPKITAKDVIKLPGVQYMIDNIWAQEFQTQIEYRHRAIPYQLVYLLHKYGPVIPQWFFVESIQEVCGTTKAKPETPRFDPADPTGARADREREELSVAQAKELITEAVELGLITEVAATGDRRYKCYKLTEDQLQKLYRIREREAKVYALNDKQAKNPENPKEAETPDVAGWYSNIMDLVNRKDEVFRRDKKKLDALRHLLNVGGVALFWLVFYVLPAAATISGGLK